MVFGSGDSWLALHVYIRACKHSHVVENALHTVSKILVRELL